MFVSNLDGGAKSLDSGFSNVDIHQSNFGELSRRYGEVVAFDCAGTQIGGSLRGFIGKIYGNKSSGMLSESDRSVQLCQQLYNGVIDLEEGVTY